MFSGLSGFFKKNMSEEPSESTSISVAVCVLLLEIAYADDEFSDSERETIISSVGSQFDLSNVDAEKLLELAEQARETKTDLFQFTRLIAAEFDRAGKLRVVEALWKVVYSDGILEAHEDALMHNLSNLIGLSHKELIALKVRVKNSI